MNKSVPVLRQPLSLLAPVAPPPTVIAILWLFAVMETGMAADNTEVLVVCEILSHFLKSSG